MGAQSDADLIRSVLEGRTEVFVEIVRRYQNIVFSLAYQRTLNRADAEDVAQEVFLRAYRDLRKLRNTRLFGRWIYGIALNVTRERVRIRRPEATLEAIAEPQARTADRMRDDLLALVGNLPDKYRLPITMHFVDGLGHREISENLSLRESTVRSRVHRAKAMLKKRAGVSS
jgi:RNA polymerase sigma-70 factor (ECF subfamily)